MMMYYTHSLCEGIQFEDESTASFVIDDCEDIEGGESRYGLSTFNE